MYNSFFVLKLKLMQGGINIEEELMQNLKGALYSDYVTCSGVMLKIGGNHYDNKSINLDSEYLMQREYVTANINSKSKFILSTDENGNFIIKDNKGCVLFHDIGISRPMLNQKEISPVAVHGDRIRVSLITGCAGDCKFCGLNKLKYCVNEFNVLKEEIDFILNLKKDVKRLFITGGNPLEKDLVKVVKTVKKLIKEYKKRGIKNFDFMFAPRGLKKYFYNNNIENEYKKFLLKIKKIGVTTVAIDLEMFNNKLLRSYAPFKNRIGKKNYFKILDLAVKVFGEGNVRSNIIVGIEPLEDSVKAIKALTNIKVQPCLSPYEPYKFLPEIKKPKWNDLNLVFQQAERICKYKKVKIAPSIYATDTHNSVASAQNIKITLSELQSFYSNVTEIKKSVLEEMNFKK